jgi:hypothetical protein
MSKNIVKNNSWIAATLLLIGLWLNGGLLMAGWLSSDARTLHKLRKQNDLNSSEKIFDWVTGH